MHLPLLPLLPLISLTSALPQTTAPPKGLAGLQFWWRDSAATAACVGTPDLEFFPANQECNIVPGAGQPGLGGYFAANLTSLTATCSIQFFSDDCPASNQIGSNLSTIGQCTTFSTAVQSFKVTCVKP